jgi:ABC-type Na+ efflux pump permease subunit
VTVTLSPSGQPSHPANAGQQARGRGRWLTAISATVGSLALVASAVWLPIVYDVARMLRPPERNGFPANRGDVRPIEQTALTSVTAIVIVSFLAIIALAVLTIVLGRRARRRSGNVAMLARMEKWATVCLIVSLLGLGIFVLLSLSSLPMIVSLRLRLPPSINQLLDIVLYGSPVNIEVIVGITAASAMGCFILNGIVARRGQRWRTPIGLVVSALILLLWFASTAWLARFLVGFYLNLHLVW